MGEVYRAQDPELGRPVALKFLPGDVAAHQSRVKRFIQEAKAASALNHPNILTVYEIGRADDTTFLATEFVDGVTLRFTIQGGLPEGTIEVGALQTLAVGGTLYAQLPAVEVVGARVVQLADAADHAEPQG